MKLLFCKFCGDIQKLTLRPRSCECGSVRGRCLPDGVTVEVTDGAIVLGIDNHSMRGALLNRETREPASNRNLSAWVFTPDYERITYAKE